VGSQTVVGLGSRDVGCHKKPHYNKSLCGIYSRIARRIFVLISRNCCSVGAIRQVSFSARIRIRH
jgi:hypothetical protein